MNHEQIRVRSRDRFFSLGRWRVRRDLTQEPRDSLSFKLVTKTVSRYFKLQASTFQSFNVQRSTSEETITCRVLAMDKVTYSAENEGLISTSPTDSLDCAAPLVLLSIMYSFAAVGLFFGLCMLLY